MKIMDLTITTVNSSIQHRVTKVYGWAYAAFLDAIEGGDKSYTFEYAEALSTTFVLDKIISVQITDVKDVPDEPS